MFYEGNLYYCENRSLSNADDPKVDNHYQLLPFDTSSLNNQIKLADSMRDESILDFECTKCERLNSVVYDSKGAAVDHYVVAYPSDKMIAVYNTTRLTCKHCNARVILLMSGLSFSKTDLDKFNEFFERADRVLWQKK